MLSRRNKPALLLRAIMIGVLLVQALGLLGKTAHAAATFEIFDVPESEYTTALGINAAGTITGWYTDATGQHGFVRDASGAFATFDGPGSPGYTTVAGINDAGAITGDYYDAGWQLHGFVRDASGAITTFDAPAGGRTIQPQSINSAGAIIGFYYDALSNQLGFLRDASGALTTFAAPAGGSHVLPQSINTAGVIVGTYSDADSVIQGFVRGANGIINTIAAPACTSCYPQIYPVDINTVGTITGYYWSENGGTYTGFLQDTSGSFTPEVAPSDVGCELGAIPVSINDDGAITGVYSDESCESHGFVRDASGVFTIVDVPGGGDTRPRSINTAGAITGDYYDGTSTHGFVYNPEPVNSASLSIPDSPIDAANGVFSVPVDFASNGVSIASVGFALDYDESCLAFDATDSDSDGIPDAITGLPSGFAASISHDGSDSAGELDLSLFADSLPIGALSDGPLLTASFTVNPACITTDGSTTAVTVAFSSDPAPSFSDTSANDVTGTADDATITLSFNATPTAIDLSNDSADENAASGTIVGTLSTTDLDVDDTHTYALASGPGDDDNTSFTLDGDTLSTNAVFDFETKNSYSVRVRTTDNGGLNGSFEESFTIDVNDRNDAPIALDLDNASVDENAPAGTTVGALITDDPDAVDNHTYALAAGAGDTDNASFTLDDDLLNTLASFNYETKSSYTIRVRTTDSGGLFTEQDFAISVNDINDAPVAVDDLNDPYTAVFVGGQATVIDVLVNDSDEDGDSLSVQNVDTTGTQGSVTNNGVNVSYTAPDSNSSSSFTYQASDGALSSNSATVSVSYVKSDLRGDCNSNGSVTAADIIGTVLELFDSSDTQISGAPAWWLSYTGDFAGSPRGCDANASKNGASNASDSVTAGDITCTVLIFFGRTCGAGAGLRAPAAASAQVAVAAASAARGQVASVTVNLNAAGNGIVAATFALAIDANTLGFDATDSDGDGVPDAVALNVPPSMSKTVSWNAARSRLEVAVFGTALPLPTLSDGALATVRFQVAADAAAGASELGLALVSLSDTDGQDLTVVRNNGALTITDSSIDNATFTNRLFLPVVGR